MSKPIKTIKELVKELKKDIKAEQKDLKQLVKEQDYEGAFDSERIITDFEYVLALIEGRV